VTQGERLGPYEILAPIGAGGMGEVYRARDTKLDRDVAVKVLPSAVAHDPERLARFAREAKVLASLKAGQLYELRYRRSDCKTLLIGSTSQMPHSDYVVFRCRHQRFRLAV
jgi:serine/threonine protein kinase